MEDTGLQMEMFQIGGYFSPSLDILDQFSLPAVTYSQIVHVLIFTHCQSYKNNNKDSKTPKFF